jgi:geranylgeranyl diphosphate synthase, type II
MHSVVELQKIYQQFLKDSQLVKDPLGLYEPVQYIMDLGGKRIRPVLALMGYELFKEDLDFALPLAQALEMFHNFTLVHDDIMDAADLRRGLPTVHQKFGTNTAILSGDVMLLKVYEYLLAYKEIPDFGSMLAYFTKMGIEICEGQQWDMEFEHQTAIDLSSYTRMIRFKTAVLLGGALRLGALLAGAGEEDCQRLEHFGIDLGLAFQIQDDILDTYGEGAKVGKKIGGDIAQCKKTFLYVTALQNLQDKEAFLNAYLSPPYDEKYRDVLHWFDRAGVKQKAAQMQEAYYNKAMEVLSAVEVSASKKEGLVKFARSLFVREA